MSVSKLYPELLDIPNNILNLDKYNGRVNILETPSPDVVFKMQERIAIKNKATPYGDALKGTFEDNLLAQTYFSSQNVQILQNGIRAGVYNMSSNKFIIAPPNVDMLKVIMRSTYMQYAEHYRDNIRQQVERLNKIVLDYAVPATYNEAVGYQRYREDQSTLVLPMERPLNHDRNYKQLELKPWF